jgi:DNA-binding transcriptional MerR regulator
MAKKVQQISMFDFGEPVPAPVSTGRKLTPPAQVFAEPEEAIELPAEPVVEAETVEEVTPPLPQMTEAVDVLEETVAVNDIEVEAAMAEIQEAAPAEDELELQTEETELATEQEMPAETAAMPSVVQNHAVVKANAMPPKKGVRGRRSIRELEQQADLVSVPDDEQLFQKQYYAMNEVAVMFNVNHSLLRYWENEFDILKPRKNRKGDRHFRPEDIKNLQVIHYLLRQKKYTIEGAKDYLKNKKKIDQKFHAIEALEKLKGFLLELKAGL